MLKAKRIFASARLLNSSEKKSAGSVWSERGRAGSGAGLAGIDLPPKTQENSPGRAFTGNH